MRTKFSPLLTLSVVAAAVSACEPSPPRYVNFSPEVDIEYPSPGAEVPEGVELVARGIVSDADQQDTLRVWWTDENGDTVCEEEGVEPPANVSCPWFPWASNDLLCLHADDGRAEDSHSEECVTVVPTPTEPPTASIIQPVAGGVYYSDTLITFQGEVSDDEDPPEDLEAIWESHLEGELVDVDSEIDQDGNIRGYGYLIEGEHAIELTVWDSSGSQATDSVIISVGPPNSGPTCEIVEPTEGFAVSYGECVELVGQVGDADEDPSDLYVAWHSTRGGLLAEPTPDSDGVVSVTVCDLESGPHGISLQVEDGQGERCVTSVAITVGIEPECEILSPASGEVFYLDDNVPFTAFVDDDSTPADLLYLEWSSSIDGVFDDTCEAGPSGNLSTNWNGFSEGDHLITLTATDEDGFEGRCHLESLVVEDCLRTWYEDLDGDGYGDDATAIESCSTPTGYVLLGGDCDDSDAGINPGATETCDGVDEDCDGVPDNGVSYFDSWPDVDSDGYGDASASATNDCALPSGFVTNDGDCDDLDSSINPGATETCDGVDEDCDGVPDNGVSYFDSWPDNDGDGYGDAGASATNDCVLPTGYVTNDGDCDDVDASVNPAATEICNGDDDDCDGMADDGLTFRDYYADDDGDGYGVTSTSTNACSAPSGYVTASGDCDDTDASINPGATESCDGVDEDCDGVADNGVSYFDSWPDNDGDGYGDAGASATNDCVLPTGYVTNDGDCDDVDASVNPAATEICNGDDDDCDGMADDGLTFRDYYADDDGDGYGVTSTSTNACSAPSGYVTASGDCDDTDASINPGATESCDGVDEDCDGVADNGVSYFDSWPDNDGDGYGDAGASATNDCSLATGYVTNDNDCDDANASIHPSATETCDGVDQDCDGSVDDGLTFRTYYADDDGDGYGNSSVSSYECSAPAGYVTVSGDCDDYDASVHPGATELCNGDDDDCDGSVDEGLSYRTYYRDYDGDGYGNSSSTQYDCSAPTGYVTTSGDCDDYDSSVHPYASELCNGDDDDCDGSVDEGLSTRTYYRDYDGDGYGDSSYTQTDCTRPSGYVTNSSDCDDYDSGIHPGATEACDGVDEDCDGTIADEPCLTTVYSQDFESTPVFSESITGNQTLSDGAEWYDMGLGSRLTEQSGRSSSESMGINHSSTSGYSGALMYYIPVSASSSEDLVVSFWAYARSSTTVEIYRPGASVYSQTVPSGGWTLVSTTLASSSSTTSVTLRLGLIASYGSDPSTSYSMRIDDITVEK